MIHHRQRLPLRLEPGDNLLGQSGGKKYGKRSEIILPQRPRPNGLARPSLHFLIHHQATRIRPRRMIAAITILDRFEVFLGEFAAGAGITGAVRSCDCVVERDITVRSACALGSEDSSLMEGSAGLG
jgi:hypothetical protein